ITKKLSGAAKGTALWLTSVSNELGQILISVLTAQEGPGLECHGGRPHQKADRAAIQDMNPDSEETDELLEDLNIEEEQEDEGFEGQYADTTVEEPYDLSIYSGPALHFLHPACCFLCFHTTCSCLYLYPACSHLDLHTACSRLYRSCIYIHVACCSFSWTCWCLKNSWLWMSTTCLAWIMWTAWQNICNEWCLHNNPKKQRQGTVTRWNLILQDYRNILGNGVITQSTTLQLVESNQTTLIQWHNKWVKCQDVTLLLQGLNLPASQALPPANIRPAALPKIHGTEHVYSLPPSTAGLAKTKRQAAAPPTAAPKPIRPKLSAQKLLLPHPPTSAPLFAVPQTSFVCPPAPATFTVFGVPTPVYRAPHTAIVPLAPSAPPPPPASGLPASKARFNKRKVVSNTCRKCGQFRTAETGHSQYQGTIYCQSL
ncbi:hypothetical protein L3Q82_020847, partial [Scortum barcoo]